MEPGRWLFILAAASLWLPPAAAEDHFSGCKIDGPRGIVDCSGRTSNDSGDEKESGGFWTSPVAQTFYAILGLGASGGAAFFGWTRVRRGRRTLHRVLQDIDETFATCKDDPLAGIERLNGIRAELATRHRHGNVDDAHFLELDRKIADHTARLRIIDVQQRFPDLSPELLAEIRHLAQDGHFSQTDKMRIEKRATALRVPVAQRRALVEYLQVWAEADPRRDAKPTATPMVLVNRGTP